MAIMYADDYLLSDISFDNQPKYCVCKNVSSPQIRNLFVILFMSHATLTSFIKNVIRSFESDFPVAPDHFNSYLASSSFSKILCQHRFTSFYLN